MDVVPGLVLFAFLPLFPKLSSIFGMRNLIILSTIPLGLFYICPLFCEWLLDGDAGLYWHRPFHQYWERHRMHRYLAPSSTRMKREQVRERLDYTPA